MRHTHTLHSCLFIHASSIISYQICYVFVYLRELAEIKDVKSQLEKELAKKDQQLQAAEQDTQALEIVREESTEEVYSSDDEESAENEEVDASEEPTGVIPRIMLRQAAARCAAFASLTHFLIKDDELLWHRSAARDPSVYEFSEDDDSGGGRSESEVVMRPRRTRRAPHK